MPATGMRQQGSQDAPSTRRQLCSQHKNEIHCIQPLWVGGLDGFRKLFRCESG